MTALGSIPMATDFSHSAKRAFALAANLARDSGASLVLLHVDQGSDAAPLGDAALARRERARIELDRCRRSLSDAGVEVRVCLRPGDPAREILRAACAYSAGMIVLGMHGQSPSGAPLLGSVADRVMRYAPTPVLVVPDPARRPGASLSGLRWAG